MKWKSHLDHAKGFDMRCELAKFVPRLLTAEQKHNRVNACQELNEEAHRDPHILSSVIICAEEYVGIEGLEI
jgi:hypothetical protein